MDVMSCKYFPYYWWERYTADHGISLPKLPVVQSFDIFFVISFKLLKPQSSFQWVGALWRVWDVSVMVPWLLAMLSTGIWSTNQYDGYGTSLYRDAKC